MLPRANGGINQLMATSSQLPDIEKLRSLPWALASGTLTNVFAIWTFAGSVFLLFLDYLHLPKAQIGTLLSLFPFCGVVALFFAPSAMRLGRKRVFLTGYGLRKFVMASLLLVPWILSHSGRTITVAFIFGIVIVFAILRALAETAYYSWMQEVVPNRVRGRFTAWSMALVTIASCAALLTAGHVIAHEHGLAPFLLLIGMGSVIGIIGVALMGKVPGGAPVIAEPGTVTHRSNMLEAVRDGNFASYLGGLGSVTIGTALMICFLPLYLKERLGLPSGTVVRLDAVVMVGGALSSLAWGWVADRVGSRPVLMPALAMSVLIPLGWLVLPRHSPHILEWCATFYFAYGVASSGIAIGASRLLYNGVIPLDKNSAYTAIYYAWMGVTGGLAPLLAGTILTLCSAWHTTAANHMTDGYDVLFFLAFALTSQGWALYGRVRPDDRFTTRMVLRHYVQRRLFGSTDYGSVIEGHREA